MSSFHNLKIIPKSDTIISLDEIFTHIDKGIKSNIFLKEFSILKINNRNKSFTIGMFDFKNYLIDATPYDSSMEVVTERNTINKTNDYLFVVYLNKSEFSQLSLFQNNKAVEKFPILIAFKSEPTSIKEYDLIDEDNEEFEEVVSESINSLIYTSGQGLISISEFKENPEKFIKLSDWINNFYSNSRAITYYD